MDFPERLTVKVTDEDIRKGTRWSPHSCPIALAANRTLFESGLREVFIEAGRLTVRVYAEPTVEDEPIHSGLLASYRTTGEASDFMHVFDDSLDAVQPSEFTFERIS